MKMFMNISDFKQRRFDQLRTANVQFTGSAVRKQYEQIFEQPVEEQNYFCFRQNVTGQPIAAVWTRKTEPLLDVEGFSCEFSFEDFLIHFAKPEEAPTVKPVPANRNGEYYKCVGGDLWEVISSPNMRECYTLVCAWVEPVRSVSARRTSVGEQIQVKPATLNNEFVFTSKEEAEKILGLQPTEPDFDEPEQLNADSDDSVPFESTEVDDLPRADGLLGLEGKFYKYSSRDDDQFAILNITHEGEYAINVLCTFQTGKITSRSWVPGTTREGWSKKVFLDNQHIKEVTEAEVYELLNSHSLKTGVPLPPEISSKMVFASGSPEAVRPEFENTRLRPDPARSSRCAQVDLNDGKPVGSYFVKGDETNAPEPTPYVRKLLETAADQIDNRASERDTDSERSMPAAVAAFNALYGHNLSVTEGWQFMSLLKKARAKGGVFREDDYVDDMAYTALAAEEAKGD